MYPYIIHKLRESLSAEDYELLVEAIGDFQASEFRVGYRAGYRNGVKDATARVEIERSGG